MDTCDDGNHTAIHGIFPQDSLEILKHTFQNFYRHIQDQYIRNISSRFLRNSEAKSSEFIKKS